MTTQEDVELYNDGREFRVIHIYEHLIEDAGLEDVKQTMTLVRDTIRITISNAAETKHVDGSADGTILRDELAKS